MGQSEHCSSTLGAKAFTIEGPVRRERYRCGGMTDAERAWRRKWVHDQILSEHEPRGKLPEFKVNPIRRITKWPLDTLFKPVEAALGPSKAMHLRYFTGRGLMWVGAILSGVYYFKYNGNTWLGKQGWRVIESREMILPNDPRYPLSTDRSKPSDYAARDFATSPI